MFLLRNMYSLNNSVTPFCSDLVSPTIFFLCLTIALFSRVIKVYRFLRVIKGDFGNT